MPQFLLYALIFGGIGGLVVLILALIWRAKAKKDDNEGKGDKHE